MRVSMALSLGLALGIAGSVGAADPPSLAAGKPDIRSLSALAFGPGGVLFVGDSKGGAVYAIDTVANKVLKKVPVGHRPRSIGFLPDGANGEVRSV